MQKSFVNKFSQSFENQFHFGMFYAYLKMKQQEIKQISYLIDLVSAGTERAKKEWL